ncbi:MAG: ATP-binding protein [Afipia sp.]|nr:ATP-binding protein [Afipia sp.]
MTESSETAGPSGTKSTTELARSITVGEDAYGNVFIAGDNNSVRVTLVVADRRLRSKIENSGIDPTAKVNPYQGLDAFYETEASFFFGRSKSVRRLWLQFRQLQRGAVPRILPVVGASGSGKSSLVRAGFLPELARERVDGLEHPRIFVLRPGPTPLIRLRDALNHVDHTQGALSVNLEAAEVDGTFRALHYFLSTQSLEKGPRSVIVVDQFEELFTECTDANARTAFLGNLAYGAAHSDGAVSIVLTIRSDFTSAVDFPAFSNALRENRFIIQAMDRDELTEAVARPALDMGNPWPVALVETLVSQAEGRSGALPLLQFALKRLWPSNLAGTLDEQSWSTTLIEDFLVEAADALYEAAGRQTLVASLA